MAGSKPIPIRLDEESIEKLDAAAKAMGNTRAGVIRFCLRTFLNHFDDCGGQMALPLNWKEILAYQDRRTSRSRGVEPTPVAFPTESSGAYQFNEAGTPESTSPRPTATPREGKAETPNAKKSGSRRKGRG